MTIVMTTNKRPHRHEINWMEKDWIITDVKSNLHHNATKRKEGYKRQRETLQEEYNTELEYQLWGVIYGPKEAA